MANRKIPKGCHAVAWKGNLNFVWSTLLGSKSLGQYVKIKSCQHNALYHISLSIVAVTIQKGLIFIKWTSRGPKGREIYYDLPLFYWDIFLPLILGQFHHLLLGHFHPFYWDIFTPFYWDIFHPLSLGHFTPLFVGTFDSKLFFLKLGFLTLSFVLQFG